MLAMCHFSWRRTKSMMNSGLPSKSKFEGKSLNKTETTKERKTTLLENICNSPKHQSPCKPRQLWECLTVGDRPRLRKCRKSGSVQATTTPTTRPTPSSAPTSPVKMCVCMKPRPGSQGDMSPYNGEKTSCNFSEMIPFLFLGPFCISSTSFSVMNELKREVRYYLASFMIMLIFFAFQRFCSTAISLRVKYILFVALQGFFFSALAVWNYAFPFCDKMPFQARARN